MNDTTHFKKFANPRKAVMGADLVTTDVWTSMGYEAEMEQRRNDFAEFCVNTEMMSLAKKDALFMHLSLIHI